MAHQLTQRENGKFEMAYLEGTEQPWHAGETNPSVVRRGSPIEVWATESGMDWEVLKARPYFRQANGARKVFGVPDKQVLHRSDSGFVLGVVSDGYKIFQPKDMLDFFKDLYHSLGLEICTAATMFGGKRLLTSAMVGENSIVEGDHVRGYLMLTTTCDGTGKTIAKFVATRPVCWNTVAVALSENNPAGTISISHRSEFDARRVKRLLGLTANSFDKFIDDMRFLSRTPVSEATAIDFTSKLFIAPDGENVLPRAFDGVMDLFRGLAKGDDLPGVHGTAWGYLNAVTEHLDHGTKAKSTSHRIDKNLFGPVDSKKTEARELVLTYARS